MAIPGYSFLDTLGNSFFVINPKEAPNRALLTKEGRVQNYWGAVMQEMAAGFGLWHLQAMPVDPYYFFWITCAAPFTSPA